MSPTQNSTLPKNQFQTRPRMYTLAFPKPCQKQSASKPFPTPVTSNWPRTKHQYHLVPTTLLRYAGIKSSSSLNYMFNGEPISILFPFPDDPEPRLSPSGGSADLPSAIRCHPFKKPCPISASMLGTICTIHCLYFGLVHVSSSSSGPRRANAPIHTLELVRNGDPISSKGETKHLL